MSVIVATRRTLFSEEERAKFIKSIMQELIKILHLPQAFNNQSNYHGKNIDKTNIFIFYFNNEKKKRN